MINRNQIGKNLNKVIAKELFDQLDTNKTGSVKAEDYVNYLNKQEKDAGWLSEFFNSVADDFSSKLEIIIKKLKGLRDNKNLEKDPKALDDIDWYDLALI